MAAYPFRESSPRAPAQGGSRWLAAPHVWVWLALGLGALLGAMGGLAGAADPPAIASTDNADGGLPLVSPVTTAATLEGHPSAPVHFIRHLNPGRSALPASPAEASQGFAHWLQLAVEGPLSARPSGNAGAFRRSALRTRDLHFAARVRAAMVVARNRTDADPSRHPCGMPHSVAHAVDLPPSFPVWRSTIVRRGRTTLVRKRKGITWTPALKCSSRRARS